MVATVFRGGRVIDGTGQASVLRDVLIAEGRIHAVEPPGRLDQIGGVSKVDATGLTLAPGFIDTHAHADNSPLLTFDDTSKILQGVTTEVNGNCGFTLAPVNSQFFDDFTTLASRIFPPFEVAWNTFSEFVATVSDAEFVTNFVTLMGHNSLRVAVMGSDQRTPEQHELGRMKDLLESALADGVCGVSSGLIYPPGVFSSAAELVDLVSVMPRSAVYASHMRNEGLFLSESIDETVAIARSTGVRCHISHLKVAHMDRWHTMPQIMKRLDEYRDDGVTLTHDSYPYTASSTMMTALLPPWMHDGGSSPLLQRLRSIEMRDRARNDLNGRLAQFDSFVDAAGWDRIVVASTASHRFEGYSVATLAEISGKDPVDAVCDLLIEEDLKVTMIIHGINEADVQVALCSPFTAIGSDGLPVGTGGKPHPRGYGSFVRVLDNYVKKEKLFSLEEAVRRMTSLAAEIFSIPDRGVIAPGKIADLVLFDPEGLRDHATFEDPTASPTGIHSVWIGGEQVVAESQFLGRRAGKFLRAQF